MILVLDLRKEGILKNWIKHNLPRNEQVVTLELMPGGVLENFRRLNEVIGLLSKVKTLFIFALRPVELFIISKAHPSINIVLIQHGIFIPLMKRSFSGLSRKVKEIILYLLCLKKLNEFNKDSLLWLLGRRKFQAISLSRLVKRINLSLVYSRYWAKYFEDNYCIQCDFKFIGNPDYGLYSDKIKHVKGLVYVAQTLVEDSRLSIKDWKRFIKQLNKYIKTKNIQQLHIKLHPRTDKTLFAELSKNIEIFYYNDELPFSKNTLGHYSTLIGLYWILGSTCEIYEFKNHPTPEFIPGSRTENLLDYTGFDATKSPEYYFGSKDNQYTQQITNLINDHYWN